MIHDAGLRVCRRALLAVLILCPAILCLAILCLSWAAAPAMAQGFPGSTVGLPANPFASNLPSAPPEARTGEARSRPTYGGRAGARRRTPPRAVRGPLPPAAVPAR